MQIQIVPKILISKEGQDMTTHGSIGFPLAVHYTVLNKNVLGYIDWHWHEELQLCYVEEGAVCFWVNEISYVIHSGEGIFINSNLLHQARPYKNPESSYFCVNVKKDMLACTPGSLVESRYVLPYQNVRSLDAVTLSQDIEWQKDILNRMKQIVQLVQEEAFGYEYRIYSQVFAIWVGLIENMGQVDISEGARKNMHQAVVRSIFSFIHTHYAEPVSAKQIAEEIAFSPEECGRIFKKITGETIWKYLITYRLLCASVLLKEKNDSISQIAYETGFGSTSYFILKFRQRFGVTPYQFRKRMQEG